MNDVNYMQSVCDNVGINYLLDLHKNSHELFLFRVQPGSRRFKGCSCVSCSTHWCKMTANMLQSVCLFTSETGIICKPRASLNLETCFFRKGDLQLKAVAQMLRV